MLFLLFVSGCASEPPFDPMTAFGIAEEKMQEADYETARMGYQEIQEKSPDKSYDPVIMLRIADTYYGEKKYSEAQVEYQAFLNYHPVNKYAPYAQNQVALCSYNEFSTIDRDPAPVQNAIKEFLRLIERYPRSSYAQNAQPYIDTCKDRLAKYELYVAKFYYKKDSYKSAVNRCENLMKTYPESSAIEDALYYAGLSYMELGETKNARRAFETLAKKYPHREKAAHAYLKKISPTH